MSREGALWIGGLEPYMDEGFLKNALGLMGEQEVLSIKVIKNKFTGEPASYGFINFESDPAALMAMHKLNGKIIPNSQPPSRFKLNHNSSRLMPGEKDCSIWVGDLSPEVDDLQLYQFFSGRFPTVRSSKVVLDSTGYSKGYGFVRFGNEQEQKTALISMQGLNGLGTKAIKIRELRADLKPSGYKSGNPFPQHAIPREPQSVADSLTPAAMSALVSSVSGNPNAGAAIMGQHQHVDYGQQAQYWQQQQAAAGGQQDYAQQQYWSQYAAWNQYSNYYDDGSGYYQQQQQQAQGYGAPPPAAAPPGPAAGGLRAAAAAAAGFGSQNGGPRRFGSQVTDYEPSIFEGDDFKLVEHTPYVDVDALNEKTLARSAELWEAIENSKWTSGDKENVVKDTLMSLAMGN